MSERAWNPGDVLAGKFRLVAPLGRGGMGAVWRAEHLALRSPVAIKLVHAHVAHVEGATERFLREAQAAAALRSPNVVQVLDFGIEADTPYIVMELLEGESLAARLRRVGRLAPADTARVVSHVARALAKAHEAGVIHRDLKPDNVFLVWNLDEELAKVLDFGIAKSVGADAPGALTSTGSVLGTPHYMSPEQARGRSDLDYRSDLWSLGVIAFECLTGKRPFESEVLGDLLLKICTEQSPVPSSLAPVPPGFDAWFARAVARNPAERFGSALEMADALRSLVPARTDDGGVAVATLAAAQAAVPVSAPQWSAPMGAPMSAPMSAPLPPPAPPTKRAAGSAVVVFGIGGIVIGVGLLGATAVLFYKSQNTAEAAGSTSSAPLFAREMPSALPSAAPSGTATPRGPVARTPSTSTTSTGTSASTTSTSTSTSTTTSDVCQRACAKIKSCGQACNFNAPCIGAYKALADCINSKKTCLDIAGCGG